MLTKPLISSRQEYYTHTGQWDLLISGPTDPLTSGHFLPVLEDPAQGGPWKVWQLLAPLTTSSMFGHFRSATLHVWYLELLCFRLCLDELAITF